MVEIQVNAESAYTVSIAGNWREFFTNIVTKHDKVLVITPDSIANIAGFSDEQFGSKFVTFIVPDGEAQKDIETVKRIWEFLGANEFGRSDAIVGIGGGAATDLAGFVAATWLRGIHWYAIATTLAGMVDASVGGKTGINTINGKNLVGSFYSPRGVCADLSWLDSLSDRDYAAGLAEVIKTGLIEDTVILDLLNQVTDISTARSISEELIARTVAVKARVVSADFTEGKLREILNFGHTLGHAVEKASGYSMRHGEAVAIGLHYAIILSEDHLGLDPHVLPQVLDLLRKFGLPTHLARGQYSWDSIAQLMKGDKKARSGQLRFIGITSPGVPAWIEDPAVISEHALASAYERILE